MNRQRKLSARKMFIGDRIQARLILNGRVVADFITDRIADMTELLNAIRFRTRELRGLARLYVRNLTQGWAEERPLMLYSRLCGTQTSRSAVAGVSVRGTAVIPGDCYSRWI